jgi:hypothetical protein
MAKIGGRQVEVGIGIEATAGTAVAATDYFKWDSFSMQGRSDKILLNSARGIRNKTSNSLIMKKYGKGSIEFVPTCDITPYILGMAFGTRNSAAHSGETLVYDHVFTIQNANASMKTATILVKQGGVQTERYANVVCDTWDFTFDKDFAKCKLGLLSSFPDTGSVTPAYTQDTMFSRNQMTAKFGTTLSAAASASPTPLVNFMLSGNNNVQMEDAFLSGSNLPVAGGFLAGPLELKGSYTLQFADTTELAKYQANTLNSVIVTITGANLGVVPTPEAIIFNLGKLVLTKAPLEYNLDGLVYIKQEFSVSYDATDHEIAATVTNGYVGTNYA